MRVVRRALAIGSALALSLALTASPAWAVTKAASHVDCEPGAAALPVTAKGKGGSLVREKATGQVAKDLPAHAKGQAPASLAATVPVWFHVITDGSLGNVSNTVINAQLAALNDGFGGNDGGDDTGFSFTLAGVTRTNNARWYASKAAGAEHEMKQALKRGNDGTLNVYTTSGGAYLGWAYLPEITNTAQAYLDGIVIDWRTMPGASTEYAGQYDEGDTLTHEAGHWLNLEHTFQGGCNRGDFVDDTPAQKNASFGCPVGKDTCRAPGADPIHNYMDYSDDACLTQFTPGQSQRMADSWVLYRAS